MGIKAIVWDLDGTLIHFNIDFMKARHDAITILESYGVLKDILTPKISILENISEAKKFLDKKYTPLKIKEILSEVDAAVIKVEHEAALEATMIPGIDQVLEFSKKNRLMQAIFTFNTQNNAKISLEKVGLLSFFDIIAGRDNVENLKPHPDHLLYICNHLNVNPENCLVIGDTSRDIEGAIIAGAKSVALKTKFGFLKNKDIIKKASYVVKENEIPSKLIRIIEDLI